MAMVVSLALTALLTYVRSMDDDELNFPMPISMLVCLRDLFIDLITQKRTSIFRLANFSVSSTKQVAHLKYFTFFFFFLTYFKKNANFRSNNKLSAIVQLAVGASFQLIHHQYMTFNIVNCFLRPIKLWIFNFIPWIQCCVAIDAISMIT